MERIPEPELMVDPAQCEAYARADFGASNQAFVDRFCALAPALASGRVLDLGCGPADVPIRLAAARPALAIVAVDASEAMLAIARRALRAAGAAVAERVTLAQGHLPFDWDPGGPFDAIVSNSLLHHLAEPDVLWREIRRFGRPGAAVLVVDLRRPASPEAARSLAMKYAGGEPEVLRNDLEASLLAAYTPDEVRVQLAEAGLGALVVEPSLDRYLVVSGTLG